MLLFVIFPSIQADMGFLHLRVGPFFFFFFLNYRLSRLSSFLNSSNVKYRLLVVSRLMMGENTGMVFELSQIF